MVSRFHIGNILFSTVTKSIIWLIYYKIIKDKKIKNLKEIKFIYHKETS